MTPDTPALQALRAAGLEHEVLSHGPARSLVEAADARARRPQESPPSPPPRPAAPAYAPPAYAPPAYASSGYKAPTAQLSAAPARASLATSPPRARAIASFIRCW